MLKVELEKVFIEHCIGCNTHKWCTNHDESKYNTYFTSCKNAISKICPRVLVIENQIPLGYENKFIKDSTISEFGRFHFPRIGAFEVYFRGVQIFSKIQSMKWPSPTKVANKILEIQQKSTKTQDKNEKKSKKVLLSPINKKKKLKKLKVKSKKTLKKSKKSLGKVKKSNFYSNNEINKEIRNYSEDTSQNSDAEEPVPPYQPFQLASIPKANEKLGTQKQIEKGSKDQIPIELNINIENKQKSHSFEEKFRGRSESPMKYSGSSEYGSSDESENYNSQMFDENFKNKGGDSSTDEKQEKDSEEYSQDDEEKYGEDYFDETSSQAEKSSEQLSDTGRRASNMEDNPKGEESDKENYEEYEEEPIHPTRKVDVSYNVRLPLAIESKKKITYQNKCQSDANFKIESSHPEFMTVKETPVSIPKGQKGKIQLRFAPYFAEEEKKFYLYIDKGDEPLECIEIVAEYVDES